jgi:hypothetical protein
MPISRCGDAGDRTITSTLPWNGRKVTKAETPAQVAGPGIFARALFAARNQISVTTIVNHHIASYEAPIHAHSASGRISMKQIRCSCR